MDFVLEIIIDLLEIIPGNKWVKTVLFIVISQAFTAFAAWIAIASPIQSPSIAVDIVFWFVLSLWCLYAFALAIEGHKRDWK